MTLPGGKIGQRERVLLVTMAYSIAVGVLTHFDMGPSESVAVLVSTAGAGVVASYTYRASTANAPTSEAPNVQV